MSTSQLIGSEGRSFRTVRGAFAFIPVGIYLFGLSYIPLPVGLEGISFGTATLARLIVLGTVFLGLLAGFAAVNGSWQYLFFLSKTQCVNIVLVMTLKLIYINRAAPSENEIHSAESSLSRVRADIEVRRREAANRRSPVCFPDILYPFWNNFCHRGSRRGSLALVPHSVGVTEVDNSV